jgi:hypothetical protein
VVPGIVAHVDIAIVVGRIDGGVVWEQHDAPHLPKSGDETPVLVWLPAIDPSASGGEDQTGSSVAERQRMNQYALQAGRSPR